MFYFWVKAELFTSQVKRMWMWSFSSAAGLQGPVRDGHTIARLDHVATGHGRPRALGQGCGWGCPTDWG